MGWKEAFEPVAAKVPSVERPTGHVPFTDKLKWTGGVLLLYFFLTNVQLWGLQNGGENLYGDFASLLASGQGSLMQLGIGPIVTASIVLQLLTGSNMLGLDTNNPRDQQLYQGLQKTLIGVMIVLTGLPMTFMGNFLPASPALGKLLGIGTFGVNLLIFIQIAIGGVLITYMDEVISKWGIGSGVGLFIVAGVSQGLVGGILAPGKGLIAKWYGVATGSIQMPAIFTAEGMNALLFNPINVIPILATLFIFALVVYCMSVRVEIPLSHGQVKGARGKYPVKLIYASVMPMIFVRALQANVQFIGRLINSQLGAGMPDWLGVYSQGQPVGGLFYYLSPIQSRAEWMWWMGSTAQEPWQILIRLGIDVAVMVVGSAIFAIFWVETTDMGPESSAEQIHQMGMQIPGFRRNSGVMEQVLERYIPQVTVLGGMLVGLLAVIANVLGTIGQVSGTGLLLTISITYKLYEEIAEEQLKNMHPMVRDLMD